jgi:hypothetical protein
VSYPLPVLQSKSYAEPIEERGKGEGQAEPGADENNECVAGKRGDGYADSGVEMGVSGGEGAPDEGVDPALIGELCWE